MLGLISNKALGVGNLRFEVLRHHPELLERYSSEMSRIMHFLEALCLLFPKKEKQLNIESIFGTTKKPRGVYRKFTPKNYSLLNVYRRFSHIFD